MRQHSLLALDGSAGYRSYWTLLISVQMGALLLALFCPPATAQSDAVRDRAVRIVALGDSLTAGLGLPLGAAFPARLEAALKARGIVTEIANAGVSGDTACRGLARLAWSVPEGTDAVIVELGANDMLLGIDPRITRQAVGEIVRRLIGRGIFVLLAGMRAAPNLGPEYGRKFEAIFPELAVKNDLLIYPFFLDGVATDATLNQPDGLHPNAAGVDVIVSRMLPIVEELIARVKRRRPA